jgi:cytochrome c-type biogenesis protein CcsB
MNRPLELQCFWLAFAGYSVASLLYVAYLAVASRRISRIATGAVAFAFVMHTVAIVLRGLHLERLPLTNMFEYMSVLAWLAAICYFGSLRIFRMPIMGAFITPVIFMLIVAASLLPKEASMQLVPALQSHWLKIHVTMAASAEAAFAVAFATNLMYFLKSALPSSAALFQRMPDLKRLDFVSYKAIAVGYPLFTVGALFAGAIWAEQAWGRFWSWDPKEVSALIVWLVYSIYLHARLVRGWSGLGAAILSAVGFICTILTFFSSLIFGGLHAYA